MGQYCGDGSPPPLLPWSCEDEVEGDPPELPESPELLEPPWLPLLEDWLPEAPPWLEDWLVLPGLPWLPDEPELPEEPWLPDDPDEGDELGIDGGDEEVDPLVVAQPASAAAIATTGHIHDCLRVTWLDLIA